MKRNVDLTQNRIFSSKRNVLLPITVKVPLPAKPTTKFICGNASERKKAMYYLACDNMYYCDRCGCRINVFPWKKERCLCTKCNEELNKQCSKRFLWKYKKGESSTNFLVTRMNKH